MKLQTIIWFGIVLMSFSSSVANAVPNPPETDPTTNPFYKNLPDVSTESRGDIVRAEVAQLDDSIFHGTTGVRVIYVSVDVDGVTKVPASMMVYYPGTPTPPSNDGQWRIMVWATGTVGLGDICANSRYPYGYHYIPELWAGRWKIYGNVAYEMLKNGHITVAPDYIGSGPEVSGVGESYLTNSSKVPAIIDGARATKTLFGGEPGCKI